VFRGCDVIHARLSPFDLGGLLCARNLGLPLLVEVNTPPLLEAKHFYPGIFNDRSERLAEFAAGETLDGAEAIVTVSSPLRDMLVSQWNVPPGKITVLPNAADSPPPTPPSRLDELRLRHGLGSGPVIVFVGALQPWHGLESLLEAFDPVRVKHSDVKLLLVGDGPLHGLLEERVRVMDLRAAVRFTGAVEHERVAEFLHLADVAVAPYPRLPFAFYFSPIKIFEYMAAGKAIVASRVGQLAEILSEGETALLVEPGNGDDLERAMRRLLRDGELRKRLGERARQKAEREHTWTGYAMRLTELYESMVTSRAESAPSAIPT
jgi:glycosyltransferase involved in cell wall biosynthesis